MQCFIGTEKILKFTVPETIQLKYITPDWTPKFNLPQGSAFAANQNKVEGTILNNNLPVGLISRIDYILWFNKQLISNMTPPN